MNRRTLVALLGAIAVTVVASGAALGASSGPSVRVEIKSFTKTLRNVSVHGERGWITKGGAPRGKCSGASGAGALDAATGGKWSGKYSSSFKDILVTSILGVTPKGNDYFELFVNGKSSNVGVCEVKLRAGETILFKEVK